MDQTSRVWGRLALDRRRVLRGAVTGAAGLAGAALIGCSSGGKPSTPAPAGGAGAGPSAAASADKPEVSDAFVMIQTRDSPSNDPMDSQSYVVPERGDMAYPRLIEAIREAKAERADTRFVPTYVTQGWELSDGGKQITFKLKKGVKYQNIAPVSGREFVAEDVKFSFNRYMTDAKSAFKPRYSDIASIETPDNYTVVFKLKTPSRYLIYAIAAEPSLITPPEVAKAEGDYKVKMIGPGPFIMESYRANEGAAFKKNPDYIEADKIYYKQYLFKVITDAQTRMAAMKTGNADQIDLDTLSATDLPTVQGPQVVTYETKPVSLGNITFNSRNPKWADYRARLAMSKAFDRQLFIDQMLQGNGTWNGVVPVGFGKWALSPDELKQVNAYKYDPAEAKKLWDAAGKKSGETNEFYIATAATSPSAGPQAEFLAQGWEKSLGVKTQIKSEDYATFLYKSYNNGYEDMNTTGYILLDPLDNLIQAYYPGGTRNGAGLNNKDVVAKLDDLRGTLDDNAAVEKARALQRYLQDTVLSMTQLPNSISWGVHNAKLRNFLPGVYPPGLVYTLRSWKTK